MSIVPAPHPLLTERASAGPGTPTERRTGPLELLAFAALAGAGALAFLRTIADPPASGLLAAVIIATALLYGLARLGPRGRLIALPAGVVLVLAALAGGLLSAGVEPRLLVPGRWDELSSLLADGIVRAGQVEMPYSGDDEPVRAVLAAATPAALVLAAALAGWPGGARARAISPLLAVLILYVIGIALVDGGSELLRAVGLCAVSALWIWARAERRGDPRLAVAVISLLAISAALMTARAAAEPGWDYRNWDPLGGARSGVSFDWNHSYGPFDWSQDGTEVLRIEGETPAYWKASVLDSFDGVTWQRATGAERSGLGTGLPLASEPPRDRETAYRHHPGWRQRFDIDVLSLDSGQVITAGGTRTVFGIDGTTVSHDGTVEGEISRGDVYTIDTYVPDPSERQLRRAPRAYDSALAAYTSIGLPDTQPREPSLAAFPLDPSDRRDWVAARDAVADSPYAGVLALTRRVTADASTPYEKVAAIERYLASDEYVYLQSVPDYRYPLASFLLDDTRGYCQQFSGAMTLMLRMAGVPARVVSGFAPGVGGEGARAGSFTVTDREAHSWVEVYFNEVGWVTFDPTPAGAPAEIAAQAPQINIPIPENGAPSGEFGAGRVRDLPAIEPGADQGAGSGGGPGLALIVAAGAGLALLSAAAGSGAMALLRRRRMLAGGSSEPLIRELGVALRRLGWGPQPGETLLGLERRLRREGAMPAARYAARLAAARYTPAGLELPSATDRRALRRALSARRGSGLRLRGYLAIPPGGPRD